MSTIEIEEVTVGAPIVIPPGQTVVWAEVIERDANKVPTVIRIAKVVP